jgi:hypothetical protein
VVGVTPGGLVDVTHEGGMADKETITFYGFAMDQRHHITGKDKMTCLEGRGRTTGV